MRREPKIPIARLAAALAVVVMPAATAAQSFAGEPSKANLKTKDGQTKALTTLSAAISAQPVD